MKKKYIQQQFVEIKFVNSTALIGLQEHIRRSIELNKTQ